MKHLCPYYKEPLLSHENCGCAPEYVYNFKQFEEIKYFVKSIFAGEITLDNADEDQSDLLNDFVDFNKRTKPRDRMKKKLQIYY